MKNFKTEIKTKRMLGYWSVLPMPQLHEILAKVGFDFCVVDFEHGTYSFQEALETVIAIKSAGMFALIRPSSHDKKEILRCLELGIDGICVPQVCTKEEAKDIVDACLYPPQGFRGASGFTRATGYGEKDFNEHAIKSNEELFISLLIEDNRGLNAIQEIASVSGVDSIYFGTYDIANTMNIDNQKSDELNTIISKAISSVGDGDITFGQVAVDLEQYQALDSRINFVPFGVDCGIFYEGARILLNQIKK